MTGIEFGILALSLLMVYVIFGERKHILFVVGGLLLTGAINIVAIVIRIG